MQLGVIMIVTVLHQEPSWLRTDLCIFGRIQCQLERCFVLPDCVAI